MLRLPTIGLRHASGGLLCARGGVQTQTAVFQLHYQDGSLPVIISPSARAYNFPRFQVQVRLPRQDARYGRNQQVHRPSGSLSR